MDFTAEKQLLWVAGGGLLIVAMLIWIIKSGVKEGIRHTPERSALPPQSSTGFPVGVKPTDGPGRYRVDGVDRESRMDVTEHIEAQSAANAKAKAELGGMVVTAVERVG